MKFSYSILLAALFLGYMAGVAIAGDGRTAGTSGAQELLIPVGARSTALGGTVISNVSGTEAMFWNPAGIASTPRFEGAFSYLDYLADMKHTFAGIVSSLGSLGHIGVSARVFSVGDIEVTTENAGGKTGQVISPAFIAFGVTYAKQMTDKVFIGMTANYISEKISNEQARGMAFDFGFQYHVGLGGLKLGAAVKNIGPNMTFDGADLESGVVLPQDDPTSANKRVKLGLASFELPSYIQFGASYDISMGASNRATILTSFRNNNFLQDEFMGGVEYSLKEILFLRGGYLFSSQDHYILGPTFGFGINLNMGGTNMMLDYALGQTDFFNNNQWFSLRFAF